jgi:hypothetical protein
MKFKTINKKLVILTFLFFLFSSTIFAYSHKSYVSDQNLEASDLNVSTSSGGGYTMDTNADYNWIEIADPSTKMEDLSSGDYYTDYIYFDQGWQFPFYNRLFSNIRICKNGFMNFGDFFEFGVDKIPDIRNTYLISVLESSFDPSIGGDIYYEFKGSEPNRYLVIQYQDMVCESTGEIVGAFQVIFYENGDIKFQYKEVNDVILPDIGLDRGDLRNYNNFDPLLPLNLKAIQFSYNGIHEVDFKLSPEKNEEYAWIVSEINNTLMSEFLGSNWYSEMGYLSEPSMLEKTKINITSITQNETHRKVDYDLWDWIYKSNSFSLNPESQDLVEFQKNSTISQNPHNLSNLIPFFLPQNPYIYSKFIDNLDDHYFFDYSYYNKTILNYGKSEFIGEHEMRYNAKAKYNESGFLMEYAIIKTNYTSYEETEIFKIESLSSDSLYYTKFNLNYDTNEEFNWFITQINNTKMKEFLGIDWHSKLGLPLNTKPGYKMKLTVNSISENSTHMTMDYDYWDFEYRFDKFPVSAQNYEMLSFLKDPWLNKDDSLEKILPYFLPSPNHIYFKALELDPSLYQDFWYYESINKTTIIYCKGDYEIRGYYNGSGILKALNIRDRTTYDTIFNLELLSTNHLKNFTISTEELNDQVWFINKYEESDLFNALGDDWGSYFGITTSNIANWYKMKINLTDSVKNETHYQINYSTTKWINRNDNFSDISDFKNSIEFRIDPFNYTNIHKLSNLMPLIIPSPTYYYLRYSNLLNKSYYFGQTNHYSGNIYYYYYFHKFEFYTAIQLRLSTSAGDLSIIGIYDDTGILNTLRIYNVTGAKEIFTMTSINENSKPSYIGLSEGETHNYKFYFNESCSYTAKGLKVEINYIDGDDFDNDTKILSSNYIMNENNEWIEAATGEAPYIPFKVRNLEKIYNNETINAKRLVDNIFMFMPNFTNWTKLSEECEITLNQSYYYNYTVEPLTNGLIIHSEDGYYKFKYNYTSEGILHTAGQINGDEYYWKVSPGLPDISPDDDTEDNQAPNITIHSPKKEEKYGNIPPSYNISVIEENLDYMYYTINNKNTTYTFSNTTGILNQTAWEDLKDGNVTIEFYAVDQAGNIGSANVTVIKETTSTADEGTDDEEGDDTTQTDQSSIPSYNLTIFFLTSIIGIVSISILFKRKKKIKSIY